MFAARIVSSCTDSDAPVIREVSYGEQAAPIASSAANRAFQYLIAQFLELLLLRENVLVEAFRMEIPTRVQHPTAPNR